METLQMGVWEETELGIKREDLPQAFTDMLDRNGFVRDPVTADISIPLPPSKNWLFSFTTASLMKT